MRLVHLSDLHLGYRQFQRQTTAGMNQREADIARVFRSAIDQIIEIQPDLVLVAGDVFHHVRPSNQATEEAWNGFIRLTRALPEAIVVIVAGNHDAPRVTETVWYPRRFRLLGLHVVSGEPKRLLFPEHDLSILAVPYSPAAHPALYPDPAFGRNVLVMHSEIRGVIPLAASDLERAAAQVDPEDIGYSRWSYVAMGEYHVFRPLAPNAFYSGAMEYSSFNIWGELQEEKEARVRGKGFIEFDLEKGKKQFHPLTPARPLIDLPVFSAQGMTAPDVDAALSENVSSWPGGIEDSIVRQTILEVPRHISRELDQRALRDYKRKALSFQLDLRRPDVVRQTSNGASGRRASLTDTVRDWLSARTVPPDVPRDALVDLGLRYLRQAEAAEHELLAAPAEPT
jgi:DNA repair exonuclease SbcCD nuclease subunit